MKYLIISLLAFFSTGALSAQQTLSGTVTDASTGEPLIGANVFLRSDFTVGTQTDLDGNFSLKIPEGTPSILVTYIGFREKTAAATRGHLDIRLDPVAQQMAIVEVRAEKAVAREFAAHEIGKLDIYLNPNSKADPLLAVDALPASTNVEETANISLRGSAPYETGVFLNNVPIDDAVRLDQSNGVGQFSIFNTAMIENLQVFPSNPPVEFGNATSGVVALNTDEQGSRDITSIVATVVGGGLYLGREISPQASLTVYGNYSSHHGLVGLNPSSLGDIRQLSAGDAGMYYVHRFSEKTLLKVFNYSLAEGYRYAVRSPSFTGEFEQGKKRNQSVLNLIWKLPNGQLDFNQGINFSKGHYTLGNIDLTNRDFDHFASLNFRKNFAEGSLKIGASWMARRRRIEGQVPLFDFAHSPEHQSFPIKSEEWGQVPELYFYGKKQLSEKWLVGAGARGHIPLFGLEGYLGGQANVFYQPDEKQRLIFSFGKYHKFLAPGGEIPETTLLASRQISVDYKRENETWLATAAVYAKQNSAAILPKNEVLGAEVFVRWSKGDFQVSGSFATVQSTLDSEAGEYPSPHDLNHYLRVQIKWSLPRIVEIGAIYKQRQGRYFLPVTGADFHVPTGTWSPIYAAPTEGVRLPDYHLLDLTFSRMFLLGDGTLIAFLNVGNVLDSRNVRFLNYNENYSENFEEYLGRRVVFFGGVWQF